MLNDALLKDLSTCASPETLLATILHHHPNLQVPVDVEMIARSVGIEAFRNLEANGFTSALKPGADPSKGIILSASGLPARRRRFSIAHQLGHFLIKAQQGDRQCTNRDLGENRRDTPGRKEEMQANRFAAGLLMPKPLFVSYVDGLGKATVSHLPLIATTYHVTLEAAASRYIDLTQSMCALVFIKDGIVRYARSSRSLPPLSIHPGDAAPPSVRSADPKDPIAWIPTETRDWMTISREVRPPKLTMQILHKEGGVQIIMLFANATAERRADEEAEKFATQSPKFGR